MLQVKNIINEEIVLKKFMILFRYSITIGAPEKILEHMLETQILSKDNDTNGLFLILNFRLFNIFLKTILLKIS